MRYSDDKRTVMTLDAGGTNFVFSAYQGYQEVVQPITKKSNASDLELSLQTIIDGFSEIKKNLKQEPVAISFAFPGPADYPKGIIGDTPNMFSYRGGVALGPMLEDKFQLPVFINNDGDLFAYGEALAGFLPYINTLLQESGSIKRFNNLIGITLGTGFGAGIVSNGRLHLGDNSIAGEAWLIRNKLHPQTNAEESISIRAIKRVYAQKAQISFEQAPEPKEIYEIGLGIKEGNTDAVLDAFKTMAEALGDALANIVTLIDAPIVIGGGLAGAHLLFLESAVQEMNSMFRKPNGELFLRLAMNVYNLEYGNELDTFIHGEKKLVVVPGSDRKIEYDPLRRTGVGLSRLGASKAIAIGAYCFALDKIDAQ